jgi:hypothetical protein
MPAQTYILDAESNPKRLEILNKAFWRGASVWLDGQEIGTAPDKQALLRGAEFQLPDGSTLKVRLIQSLMGSELHILRNGQPIPGSASHPETLVKSAYWVLYLIAVISLVFGAIGRLMHINMLGELGVGDFSLAFGLIYIVLGYLVRRHSALALYAGIALFAADTVLGLVLTAQSGGTPNMFNIVLRGLMFIPMIQAVGPLRTLRKSDRTDV